jgi:hypothetical protein
LMDVVSELPKEALPAGQKVYTQKELGTMWAHVGAHYAEAGDKENAARYFLKAVDRGGKDSVAATLDQIGL